MRRGADEHPSIPRLTFVVDAVDDVLDRLRSHGAELVGEVAQYGDIYRYCYVRGPDGIIIGLLDRSGAALRGESLEQDQLLRDGRDIAASMPT